MDTIKVGEIWKCIKTVHMENSGEIAYVSGNLYLCEVENCLTDVEGCKKHVISSSKFLAEHFEKLTKNAYTDFKPGQVLKRTKKSKDSIWLLRKAKAGFLRIKSRIGDPAWCTSMLAVNDDDTYELASPTETAWFEHCEKNQAFSLEDFRKLKEPEPVKLGFQPGDKVEFFRQPESFEWDGIGEIPISFYIGQVLEVCFYDPIRGFLGVIEHSSRAYPASCFRKVEFSSMSYPEIEPTPVNEPPYSTFEVGDKVYFYSRWLGYELGLNFDSHFKLDGTTTYTVTATRKNGKFIRFANGCTVDAKYLKKVEGFSDYPRWSKSDHYYYYDKKPNFYIIRADKNFNVSYRCEHLDGVHRSIIGEKPISSYELEQLSKIPIYVGSRGGMEEEERLKQIFFEPETHQGLDRFQGKGLGEQIEDLRNKYTCRPNDTFKPQKKDLPDLHKTEKSSTFDTEIERVKDLSNIKLFKPSKNRYS